MTGTEIVEAAARRVADTCGEHYQPAIAGIFVNTEREFAPVAELIEAAQGERWQWQHASNCDCRIVYKPDTRVCDCGLTRLRVALAEVEKMGGG